MSEEPLYLHSSRLQDMQSRPGTCQESLQSVVLCCDSPPEADLKSLDDRSWMQMRSCDACGAWLPLHMLHAKDVGSKAVSVSSVPVNFSKSLHGTEIWTGNDRQQTLR